MKKGRVTLTLPRSGNAGFEEKLIGKLQGTYKAWVADQLNKEIVNLRIKVDKFRLVQTHVQSN